MTPVTFSQANARYGPPVDLDDNQAATIHAFQGTALRGSCEGASLVVVAWVPTVEELQDIKNGAPIYLTCIGGLPPHFLTTRFEQATNPA